jgi:hypothetical protein
VGELPLDSEDVSFKNISPAQLGVSIFDNGRDSEKYGK